MQTITIHQWLVLTSLKAKGWPAELVGYLLSRCDASPADYQQLLDLGWVEATPNRILLTKAGAKSLRLEKMARPGRF